jgi:hypothetical protein
VVKTHSTVNSGAPGGLFKAILSSKHVAIYSNLGIFERTSAPLTPHVLALRANGSFRLPGPIVPGFSVASDARGHKILPLNLAIVTVTFS